MTLNGRPCREITWAGEESGLLQWCGEQAEELFRSGERPDAVLAYSDMAAVKILEAAEVCGLRIPEDLSLIGFDNISFGGLPQMELTTVSQKKFRAGRLAVDRLLKNRRREHTDQGRPSAGADYPLHLPKKRSTGGNIMRGIPLEERKALGALLDTRSQGRSWP